MATWSGIRAKLENDYLAPVLRGRIQYFATTYKKCHDREGRAAICLDGEEILKSGYYQKMFAQSRELGKLQKEQPELTCSESWCMSFDEALNAGEFDQRNFYAAFQEFDNQSIEESLISDDPIVRLFAVLDRRVGKRRLLSLKKEMGQELEWLRPFCILRLEAEGLLEVK